jgi:acyl carrier protein
MIPAEFLVLDQFPLTSNGKLDRHALTTLATSRLPEVDYVPPRNAVEEVLAGIWSGVLDRNRIGINDNFFDIGGHSLLATQIMAHIRSTLRIDLPLRRLFEAPTIERLAQVILADETTPGQIDKIARVVMKLAHMSAEEAGRMLEQKKKQEREQS